MATDAAPVSGVNVFWCMAGLAMACMAQSSFMGCATTNDVFANSLYPHRSSPFVCLVDTVVDWAGPVRLFYRSGDPVEDDEEDNEPTSAAAGALVITMRLVVFFFAILPLALQLFSMRGIPGTQALGAVFFICAVLNTTRNLRRVSPSSNDLAAAKKVRSLPERYDAIAPYGKVTLYLGFATVAQFAVLLYACCVIVKRNQFQVSDTVSDILNWITVSGFCIFVAVSLVQARFNVVASKASVLCVSYFSFYFNNLPVFSARTGETSEAAKRGTMAAFAMLFYLSASCFGVAWLLTFGVQRLLRKHRRPAPNEHSSDEQDCANNSNEPRASMDITDAMELLQDTTVTTTSGLSIAQAAATPILSSTTKAGSMPSIEEKSIFENILRKVENPDPQTASDSTSDDSWWKMLFLWPMFLAFALWMFQRRLERAVAPRYRRRPAWRSIAPYAAYGSVRLIRSPFEVMSHSFAIASGLVASHAEDVSWIAFAMINFTVAAIYYLVVFDPTGTSMPAWGNLVN